MTRPKHQADQLCDLISTNNGVPVLFPTIEIRSILNSEKLSTIFSNIDQYDYIIFVSRNAVNVVFDHYLNNDDMSSANILLLAIGSGTAMALSERNLTNVLHAGVQADSENLLMLEQLDSEHVRNKKILIVRGVGGRELLADNLSTRGATVEYAEVYQRVIPDYPLQQCQELWQNEPPAAIIISSNEGLENFLNLMDERSLKTIFNTPLVVMSTRNAELAIEKGFESNIGIAEEKNDKGLLSVLLDLVGEY